MDFMLALYQPNGVGKAILFYVLHLIIVMLCTYLMGIVFAREIGTFDRGLLWGAIFAAFYCSALCGWVVHRRGLDAACYAFLLLVVPAAILGGGFLGLIVPAILSTRGS
jgi:hypothetical protein